jgi:hypothetical protein
VPFLQAASTSPTPALRFPAGQLARSRIQLCDVLLARALGARPERADAARERLQILARDFEREAVPCVHVRSTQQPCEALAVWRIVRNERPQVRTGPCASAAELVEVMQLGQGRGEHHEHRLADRLRDLVQLEGCDGMTAVREVARDAAVELGGMLEVVREGLLSERVVHGRRELGNSDGDAASIVERHALGHDIAEERAAPAELLAHVLDRVHDEADRRITSHVPGAILAVCPECLISGQRWNRDQHQDIQIAHIAADAILDPVAARMAAVQDHTLGIGHGADDADDRAELPLLGGWEMRDGPCHVAARGRLAIWERRPRHQALLPARA